MMSTRRQRKLRKSVSDGLYQSFNLPVLDWSGLVVQSGEIRVTTGWTKWDDHHSVLKVHLIKQVWHCFCWKKGLVLLSIGKSMLLWISEFKWYKKKAKKINHFKLKKITHFNNQYPIFQMENAFPIFSRNRTNESQPKLQYFSIISDKHINHKTKPGFLRTVLKRCPW